MKKWITLFLLIAGMNFLSSCDNQSVNAEDNWPTYTNQSHGYAFRYPPDCVLGPMPPDCKKASPEQGQPGCTCFLDTKNPDRILMQRWQNDDDQPVMAEFSITSLKVAGEVPSDTAGLMAWLAATFPEGWRSAEHQQIMIDGHPAVRLSIPQSDMAPAREEITLISNDDLFQISLLAPDVAVNDQLYQHILASFHLER